MIRERVNAGLARAKASGVKLGRPTIPPAVEKRIRGLHKGGMGMVKIGRTLGIGTSAVQRVLARLRRGHTAIPDLIQRPLTPTEWGAFRLASMRSHPLSD